MLFYSLEFIFFFLPPVICLYYFVARSEDARLWVLVLASIMFYGVWDVNFIPLLVLSIAVNWFGAGFFIRMRRPWIVTAAIVGNLFVLVYYKYLLFFAGVIEGLTGVNAGVVSVSLPIGISFFTFHHIIYWVDLRRNKAPHYSLRDYAMYIAFFPQLLAGPLVRNAEIVPQYPLSPVRPGWQERLGRGTVLFVIGLLEKVFLADALAADVIPTFAKAAHEPLTMLEAWRGALSFGLQIYFDFSGYSDMALGLALMFGFVLPQNFELPYRAASLREFWRRWHMTLSRFLRDYLYVPLGGNRHGLARQMMALIATMALGGLWHGAGWTFVIWGASHGLGLSTGVLWRRWLPPMPAAIAWPLTMVFVMTAWVFFRTRPAQP